MTKYIEVIHNIETGEISERPYTDDEIVLHQAHETKIQNELAVLEKAATEKDTKRKAVYAKLGLTADEIDAITN